ncbi:uncharacterized protein TNCV_629471 [Trichonephila clavipes]|nr:uncharacterized protein TNCV_629471 [Trichonephila clavipes]
MANELPENPPPERDKSVKGYASKVFKESSVSAVSAIVSTGNTPRKVFRILVFVLFTAGFLYQCIKFFTYILTYPTVVNIEIDRPDEYLAPGYTFCNYNSIKRSKFCSKYPNSCTYPNQEFCNMYPDYCGDNTTKVKAFSSLRLKEIAFVEQKMNFKLLRSLEKEYYGNLRYVDACVPMEDSKESLNMEDAIDLGHDSKNLLIWEAWENPEGPFLRLNAEEQVPVPCYSLGVRVDDSRDARYKIKDEWKVDDDEFVFDAEERELFYPNSKPGILFAIHSPFEAVDPFEEGIFMKPGYLYRITLQMFTCRNCGGGDRGRVAIYRPFGEVSLSLNRTVTCMVLKANDRRTSCPCHDEFRGPRSDSVRQMCRHKCVRDIFEYCFNCTDIRILYPKKTRICGINELGKGCASGNAIESKAQEKILKSCLKNCKDDCSRMKFSYRVQESFITQKMVFNSTRISSRHIKVKIYFDDSEILTIRYKPEFQEVEAFSYIGGFIGIWLGISLVQVADVLESIFRITRYVFKKGSTCSMKPDARTESGDI